MTTKIEWATEVWNPVTGCTKVSEGCRNCYAEKMARRLAANPKLLAVTRAGYEGFKVHTWPDRLDQPLRWRKPRRIFVCSMGDLFHEDVPDTFIESVFDIIAQCPQHTFLVLTKRPDRMSEWIGGWLGDMDNAAPLPNLWLGVSIEDQKTADERIPFLLQTPAAVLFVSCEPMLGPMDLTHLDLPSGKFHDALSGMRYFAPGIAPIENRLGWVICGGESGPGARPMHPDWARGLRDQCISAGVPFFLKQMPVDGKLVKMPELDGRVWKGAPDA